MPRTRMIVFLMAALGCLLWQTSFAEVRTHSLFSSGMVLQRGAGVPVWGSADDGERVTVRIQDQEASATASGGRWMVRLENLKAGGPFEMTVSGSNTLRFEDVMVGEVWIAGGESNMEWPLLMTPNAPSTISVSHNPAIRLFNVSKRPAAAPLSDLEGTWQPSAPESVRKFSAVSYFFARDLENALNVPVGVIQATWSGTPAEAWTSKGALEGDPALKHHAEQQAHDLKEYLTSLDELITSLQGYREDTAQAIATGRDSPAMPSFDTVISPARRPKAPSNLFNGMIAPLAPYAARGVLWYQGESNVEKPAEYQTLLTAMIRDWRGAWHKDDLHFLIVQLAPYGRVRTELRQSRWAEIREAQLMAAKNLNHTGIVVITDAGTEFELNPKQKEPVGTRLALAARALAYNQPVVYSGPLFERMEVDGHRAVLSFDHVGGGLKAEGGPLRGFAVAGRDGKFRHAEAEIRGDKVVVWNSQIDAPIAVRYSWEDFPSGNLTNREGLPASPFRSDVPYQVARGEASGR